MSHSPLLATVINIGNINGIGPYGNPTAPSDSFTKFTSLISNIIGLMTVVAGLWFVIQIVISGFQWITAGGDKQVLQNTQKKLTNAFIGLFIVVLSYTIIGLVGIFLGLDIINLEIILALLIP